MNHYIAWFIFVTALISMVIVHVYLGLIFPGIVISLICSVQLGVSGQSLAKHYL